MRKIKRVTLLKDLPGIKEKSLGVREKDTTGLEGWRFYSNGNIGVFSDLYPDDFVIKYPDWFRVDYEEEVCSVNIFAQSMDTGELIKEVNVIRLNNNTATSLYNHLVKSKNDFFKNRCKECGGLLINTGCYLSDKCNRRDLCLGCVANKKKCQSCEKVAE